MGVDWLTALTSIISTGGGVASSAIGASTQKTLALSNERVAALNAQTILTQTATGAQVDASRQASQQQMLMFGVIGVAFVMIMFYLIRK